MFLFVSEAERNTPPSLHPTESGRQRQAIPFKKQPERVLVETFRGEAGQPI